MQEVDKSLKIILRKKNITLKKYRLLSRDLNLSLKLLNCTKVEPMKSNSQSEAKLRSQTVKYTQAHSYHVEVCVCMCVCVGYSQH